MSLYPQGYEIDRSYYHRCRNWSVRLHGRRRAPDVHVGARPEQGPEEPEALQVVEVQVGEEDVELVEGLALHGHAQRPHAPWLGAP